MSTFKVILETVPDVVGDCTFKTTCTTENNNYINQKLIIFAGEGTLTITRLTV